MPGGITIAEDDFEIEVDDGEDFEIEVDDGEGFEFDGEFGEAQICALHSPDLVDVVERVVPGAGFSAEAPGEDLWDPGTADEARHRWGDGWDIHAALAAANIAQVQTPNVDPTLLDAPHFDEMSIDIPASAEHTEPRAHVSPPPPEVTETLDPTPAPAPPRRPSTNSLWLVGASVGVAAALMLVVLGALATAVLSGTDDVAAAPEPELTIPSHAEITEPAMDIPAELDAELEPEAPEPVAITPVPRKPDPKPTAAAPATPRPAPAPAPAPVATETEPAKKGLFGKRRRKKR